MQATAAPLFLSLDLPEDKDWTPPTADDDTTEAEEDAPSPDPSTFFVSSFRTRSYEDTQDEADNLEARQAIERQKYYQNAATLNEAGVTFSFMTADVDARDIRANLRTMIENGLPEDVALAALTTRPANMLALSDQLGTVEPGKIANLVVTDGSYFDEEAVVRYVFVDGHRFEIEEAAPEPADGAAEGTANPAGRWRYTVATPQGDVGGTIEITGEPGDLEGTITSDMNAEETDLDDVALNGATLSFSFDSGQMGQISATATIRGNEMDGTLDIPNYGSAPISGTRSSDPNR